MDNFYARSVFFVRNGKEALAFYTEKLGFSLDWDPGGHTFVFQVSLFGFELILNQVDEPIKDRVGYGRAYIGLEDNQSPPFCQHILGRGIHVGFCEWGRTTVVIRDLDGNELFFWIPESDLESLKSELAERDTAPAKT